MKAETSTPLTKVVSRIIATPVPIPNNCKKLIEEVLNAKKVTARIAAAVETIRPALARS